MGARPAAEPGWSQPCRGPGAVPPARISASLPTKWEHGAGRDLSAAFWKCPRFSPRGAPPAWVLVSPKAGKTQCVCRRKKAHFILYRFQTRAFYQERFEILPLTRVSLRFQCVCSVRPAWLSEQPLKQFKPLPRVLFEIQPWLSCGFPKYSMPCMGAGKAPDLSPSQAGMQSLGWMCCQSLVWISEKL